MALVSQATAQTRQGYVRLTRIYPDIGVQEIGSEAPPKPVTEEVKITEKNTVITTGPTSSVVLVFSNGATVSLGHDSRLNILEYKQDPFAGSLAMVDSKTEPANAKSRTEIFLQEGELVGDVKKLNEGSSFKVATPAGAAGIRGTIFRVVFRPTGTGQAFFTVTTLEGNVGVTTNSGTTTDVIPVLGEQEVVIEVDVDPVTGAVTLITPVAALVAAAAPESTLAAVTETAQQIEAAVVEIVLTSAADQVGTPSGDEGGGGTASEGEGSGTDDGNGDSSNSGDGSSTDGGGSGADGSGTTDGGGTTSGGTTTGNESGGGSGTGGSSSSSGSGGTSGGSSAPTLPKTTNSASPGTPLAGAGGG